MNLALHFFKKDVRHLRGLLVLWFALTLAQASLVLSANRFAEGDMVLQGVFSTISYLAPVLQALLLMVMIPLLIHDEPLVGSRAFWLTRPIHRRTLLSSKALFILLLFILPPFAAEIATFVIRGATAADIGLAIPEILIDQLNTLFIIAVLAVLTSNFARYVVVGVVGFVALTIAAVVFQSIHFYFASDEMRLAVTPNSLTASRALVGSGVTILMGTLVVVHQYLTRKNLRSSAIAALALLLVVLSHLAWPWDFFKNLKSLPHNPPYFEKAISISLSDPFFNRVSDVSSLMRDLRKKPRKQIFGDLTISKSGGPLLVFIQEVKSRVEYSDRTVIQDTVRQNVGVAFQDWDLTALESALDGAQIANVRWDNKMRPQWMTVDSDVYEKYGLQHGRFTADLLFGVYEYKTGVAMPLRKGERSQSGSSKVVIIDLLREGGGCRVVLRTQKINLLFGKRDQISDETFHSISNAWVLLNRKRKVAFVAERDYSPINGGICQNGRLSFETAVLHFTSVNEEGGPSAHPMPPIDEEWLQDAELVSIEVVPLATCGRSLRIEDFLMNEEHAEKKNKHLVGANTEALAKIVLPENPTKDQVRSYVREIQRASRDQDRLGNDDPQAEMFKKVGAQNVDVLLEFYTPGADAGYLRQALEQLIGPEHKAFVIAGLAKHADWASFIVKQGWHEGARDILVDGLKKELRKDSPLLPTDWIQSVANLRDAATYDDLKTYLIRASGNRSYTYDAIKDLPGFDVKSAMLEAWHVPEKLNWREYVFTLEPTLGFGDLSALNYAFDLLRQEAEDSTQSQKAKEAILKYTEITGDRAALVKWHSENKDRIVFDEEKKKFVVRKTEAPSSAAAPSASPPVGSPETK